MIPVYYPCFLVSIFLVLAGFYSLRNHTKWDYQNEIHKYYRGGYEQGYFDGDQYRKNITYEVKYHD